MVMMVVMISARRSSASGSAALETFTTRRGLLSFVAPASGG